MLLDNIVNDEIFIRSLGFVADTVLVDPDAWILTRNNATLKTADVSNGTCGSVLALPTDTTSSATNTNNTRAGHVTVFSNSIAGVSEISLRGFKNKTAEISVFNNVGQDRKSTRLNSSHVSQSRMPSSA